MSTTTVNIPTAAAAPPAPVQLLQWQNVETATLANYAPAPPPTTPMPQYAVQTVMAWAQSQGFAGAIPTWEIGTDSNNNPVWGVIAFANNPQLTMVTIPLSAMESFETSDTAMWGQAVMRWSQANGYQMAIPTYLTDGNSVTALAFGSQYPGITFYDSPNTEHFAALSQSRLLCNLADPAVWANAAMRVAMNKGFAAGWPTWEWTTSRGIMGLSQYDLGALPDPTDENVKHVLDVLQKSWTAVQFATADALSDFSGVYETFNSAPVADPGLVILTDVLFGAVEIGLNAIPVVGGALGALVSTAVTVAQDAAATAGGSGPTTLEDYQGMLQAASDATVKYISNVHDTLLTARQNGILEQVWTSNYQSLTGGQVMQLGMLATATKLVYEGDTYWTDMQDAMTTSLNENLQVAITNQLYFIMRRTYQNRKTGTNYFYGSQAEVTSPTGKMAEYITDDGDDGDNWSVWFTDFAEEPGHLKGEYCTATMYWLQSNAGTGLPEYAPMVLAQALFSSDGLGNTSGYTGAFAKSTVYQYWLLNVTEYGTEDQYTQSWNYTTDNYIVTAQITTEAGVLEYAGWTDAYGNLNLNQNNSIVVAANQTCGFVQNVIVNFLGPLN